MVKDYKVDKIFITITALLVLFGLIMVYSSTVILAKEKHGDSFYYLKKQLVWLGLGFLVFLTISLLKYPIYLNRKFVFAVIILSIIALIMVFFSGKINQSYRWIRFGGLSIQPSEFAKIAVVMYLSYILSRRQFDVNNLRKLMIWLLPVMIIGLLIMKEPDYGNFILISVITMIVLFVGGIKVKYLVVTLLILAVIVFILLKFSPAKMNRVMAFLHPEDYMSTYGFQTLQSVYAVGTGGVFGQGLGNSTQKLYFLPYAYTDFIFAIIGEETGFVGCLVVIGLFLIFLSRSLNIAKFSGNRHCYLLVIGLTFLILVQAMINISVTIGIFPTKGIPLPFISNGGSSLLASLIISGVILNVSRHRKMVLLND